MKRTWLRIVVTIALLGLLAWKADWAEIGKTFAQVPLVSIVLALLIYAAAQVFSSVRWATLAAALGIVQPLRRYVRLYCIGMFANLFLPTSVGGDVVRALRLGALSGRTREAACSVLADRLSGLGMLLLIAAVAVALLPADVPFWLRGSIWAVTALSLAFAIVCRWAPSALPQWPGMRVVIDSVRVQLDEPRTALFAMMLALIVQGFNVVIVWVLGVSLDLPIPTMFYLVLVPTVSLLTVLPISLNGMGVREGATMLLLAPYGVSAGQAITLSVLWFLVMSAVSLSGAGFYLAGTRPAARRAGDAGTVVSTAY